LAAFLAAAVGLGLWFGVESRKSDAQAAVIEPPRVPVGHMDAGPRETERSNERSPTPSTPNQPTLSLSITAGDGRASGTLYWTHLPPEIVPAHLLTADGRAIRAVGFAGEVDLPLSPDCVTWIRVQGGGAAVSHSRLLRFGPATESQRVRIDLEDSVERVHVVLFASDMARLAGGQTIVAERPQPTIGRPLNSDDLGRADTDSWGYASIPCGRGHVTVRPVGARAGSRPPFAATIVMHPGGDAVVALALQPRRRPLTVVATADGENRGIAAKLFARDVHTGVSHPLGDVVPGRHRLEAEVPQGVYELGVVPLAEFAMTPTVIEVGDRPIPEAAVTLWRCQGRVRLKLQGLAAADFPVTVNAREPDRTWGPDDRLICLGPYHWQRDEYDVPEVIGPRQIVVMGRGRTLISTDAVALQSREVVVSLAPAASVETRFVSRTTQPEILYVGVRGRGPSVTVALRRTLVLTGDTIRAGHVGHAVLPLGTTELECFAQDGTTRWTRSLELSGNAQLLVEG
jgi:hypothetical protein